MNLYLISQKVNNDYDTFDSAVVAASGEDEARATHPYGNLWGSPAWNGSDEEIINRGSSTWANTPADVSVEYIGEAASTIGAGVICASFNAG